MKRACYCINQNNKYELRHVKSLRSNGDVDIEQIDTFKDIEFDDMIDMFKIANLSGYGILGSLDEIENKNKDRYNKKRNGLNMMNPDDL